MEGTEFSDAGHRVTPVMQRLLDKLNADFPLQARNELNHIMIILDEQRWHHAPPHADGHPTGGFFDL